MNIYSLETGYFKLDGGAMFGVVPKTMWQKWNEPDPNNLCDWALRCLLIEEGDRLVLIDNGIGDKQDAKFMSHYYLHGEHSLDSSLARHGFHRDDITDVFLTHLHFDHCGGSILRKGDQLVPAFKNAAYWSNEAHWKWATQPNDREKASFLKENILPIQESGQLKMVKGNGVISSDKLELADPGITPSLKVRLVHGHTSAMMLPQISYKGKTIVFMADLLPSVAHIPIPYVMAYDTFPLTTMQEKKSFLAEAVQEQYILFFEHDPKNECCLLQETDRGIRSSGLLKLSEI
jgi:glyoxylase-like metal-dependent hydrolase (beta-lactamase superfamily II)